MLWFLNALTSPVFLCLSMQRGRTPEALQAYSFYKQATAAVAAAGGGSGATALRSSTTTAAAAAGGHGAATAPSDEIMADVGDLSGDQQEQQQGRLATAAGGTSSSSSRMLMQRQLHALMSSAAAELPAALCNVTVAGGVGFSMGGGGPAGAGGVLLTQGLDVPHVGGNAAVARLASRGVEPAVFLSPLVSGPSLNGLAAADQSVDDGSRSRGGYQGTPAPAAGGGGAAAAEDMEMDVAGGVSATPSGFRIAGRTDAYRSGGGLFGGVVSGRDVGAGGLFGGSSEGLGIGSGKQRTGQSGQVQGASGTPLPRLFG